ncbi:MAG: hypothetical protein AAFV88_03130 [Planctomycetota bacterium]
MQSTILNVFPSQCGNQRLVLVSDLDVATGTETLMLRQESRSPDVGWFVQSCISIEPDQAAALKMTLTSNLVQRQPIKTQSAPAVIAFPAAVA